jgi:hypothetical protein
MVNGENGMMNQIEFEPKYKSVVKLSFMLMIPSCFCIVIFMLLTEIDDPVAFIIALIFSSFIIFVPFVFYKKITFWDSYFQIDRYILEPRKFFYSDITDIGLQAIRTRNGNIAFNSMENANELLRILNQKIKEGAVAKGQIEGKQIKKDIVGLKAIVISIPIGFAVSIIVRIAGFYPQNINPKLVSLGIWIVCLLITHALMKKT